MIFYLSLSRRLFWSCQLVTEDAKYTAELAEQEEEGEEEEEEEEEGEGEEDEDEEEEGESGPGEDGFADDEDVKNEEDMAYMKNFQASDNVRWLRGGAGRGGLVRFIGVLMCFCGGVFGFLWWCTWRRKGGYYVRVFRGSAVLSFFLLGLMALSREMYAVCFKYCKERLREGFSTLGSICSMTQCLSYFLLLRWYPSPFERIHVLLITKTNNNEKTGRHRAVPKRLGRG